MLCYYWSSGFLDYTTHLDGWFNWICLGCGGRLTFVAWTWISCPLNTLRWNLHFLLIIPSSLRRRKQSKLLNPLPSSATRVIIRLNFNLRRRWWMELNRRLTWLLRYFLKFEIWSGRFWDIMFVFGGRHEAWKLLQLLRWGNYASYNDAGGGTLLSVQCHCYIDHALHIRILFDHGMNLILTSYQWCSFPRGSPV